MPGVITHYTYDLMTNQLLSEGLPFTGITWGQKLNANGSWGATLNLDGPGIKKMAPRSSTVPGRTVLLLDIDGAIVWGGIIWSRNPTRASAGRSAAVGGIEFGSYFTSRDQAADYTTTSTAPGSRALWDPTTGAAADPCSIAAQLVADAIALPGSALATMTINIFEQSANSNLIVESYPIAQRQSVASLMTTLMGLGYGTGFDFSFDVSWSNGQGSTPVVALNISYPRRGRIAGSTGLVVAEPVISYQWPEDATGQGNLIHGAAGGSSLTADASDPAVVGAGWPLLEQTTSYAAITSADALASALQGELAVIEWPLVTPQVVVPLIGSSLAIGDFMMGDDSRVMIDPDEWFDTGIDTYARIIQSDFAVPEGEVATMALTFGQPPGLAPVAPLPT